MRVVLIDDEVFALQNLKYLLDEISEVEIVGMFESPREALEQIAEINPDVIFLDIEMPEFNGITLFHMLLEILDAPNIIFSTAYNKYAIEAFELQALDYLLKPVDKDRLLKSLARVKRTPVKTLPLSSLAVSCFGRFSLQQNGQEILVPWRTKKEEELLSFLTCMKGQFVSKEKIAESLWPDLDGTRCMQNLYGTLYHIKKDLSAETLSLIDSERGKMRIRLDAISCDLIDFEAAFQRYDETKPATIEEAEFACELYRGMLFEENYYWWASEYQMYLDSKHCELCLKLATHFEKEGNLRKANAYRIKGGLI